MPWATSTSTSFLANTFSDFLMYLETKKAYCRFWNHLHLARYFWAASPSVQACLALSFNDLLLRKIFESSNTDSVVENGALPYCPNGSYSSIYFKCSSVLRTVGVYSVYNSHSENGDRGAKIVLSSWKILFSANFSLLRLQLIRSSKVSGNISETLLL